MVAREYKNYKTPGILIRRATFIFLVKKKIVLKTRTAHIGIRAYVYFTSFIL